MKAALVLDTPGPTPATVRHLPFKNMRRPWFPLDAEMADPQPVILK
jgi:microcystin degradation protein MlrC